MEDFGVNGYININLKDKDGNVKYNKTVKNKISDIARQMFLYNTSNVIVDFHLYKRMGYISITAKKKTGSPGFFSVANRIQSDKLLPGAYLFVQGCHETPPLSFI